MLEMIENNLTKMEELIENIEESVVKVIHPKVLNENACNANNKSNANDKIKLSSI